MNKKEILVRLALDSGFGLAIAGMTIVCAAMVGIGCVQSFKSFVDTSKDVKLLLSK